MTDPSTRRTRAIEELMAHRRTRVLIFGTIALMAGVGFYWYMQKKYLRWEEIMHGPGVLPTWERRVGRAQVPVSQHRPGETLIPSITGGNVVCGQQRMVRMSLPGDADNHTEPMDSANTALVGQSSDETQSTREHVSEH
ncbi:hypothetical protein OBBRIDRAFT_798992 [Obba rivulosa]|uniref:Uncharacterized protein n=1 Tax=Obba rivulosa TaxID=1052685 RepID=A0A8E2ALP1_9APHY|nr:hypothetical protein OBBRIDRAFT_798992 [Obba rivulosa]